MLQLKNIKKSYTTAGYTQNALDGVSVAFRDNEFAAVLGPSGSGKTTMLNVIGGLDRYDSGDLEIDGISTKNYKASDWDTYRNNRVGFVFQSYNLIPHQNVLANVELALTLSGVSKSERRRRAKEALEQVGLGKHLRKKPNQLSGGQMQRVAIARALINDPEILMADEPTGALDSATSLQVMELLTKIAKDRLVIMVTHNNALAEKYANRIIHLTDGQITSDSHPYDPASEPQREAVAPRRSRMSFFTAISLSFSNLMTKKGRTFTTAFAGSIGIIGIATIMAFSNGINLYIGSIEEDTLSVYPLSIQQQDFDFSSFFTPGGGDGEQEGSRPGRTERPEGTVREMRIMESVFSSQQLNDLGAFKTHIEANRDDIDPYVNAIQYVYDITPNIYIKDTSKGIDRINPDEIFSSMMGGDSGSMPSMGGMGPAAMMNNFHELPGEKFLYETQYEVLTGRWPQEFNEAVLVLQYGGRILDFTLYSLGIRDRDELRAIYSSVMQGSEVETELSESEIFYPYETFLNTQFKIVNPAETYQYDDVYEVWVDKSGDTEYMRGLLAESPDLNIVGIVQPLADASMTVLQPGVNYTPELITYLMEASAGTQIVRQQLANPDVNVISGQTFEQERETGQSSFDFSRIISVDEEAISDAMGFGSMEDMFSFDNIDMSGFDTGGFDMSSININMPDMSSMDMGSFEFDYSSIDMSAMPDVDMSALTGAFAAGLSIPPEAMTGLIQTVTMSVIRDVLLPGGLLNPPVDMNAVSTATNTYLTSDAVQGAITAGMAGFIDTSAMENQMAEAVRGIVAAAVQSTVEQMADVIDMQVSAMMAGMTAQINQSMQSAMSQISRQMESAMGEMTEQMEQAMAQVFEDMAAQMEAAMESFDEEALAEAFQIEISEEAIYELMSSMMNPSATSYDRNLSMLGYADTETPAQIMIYPLSFEAKQEVLDFIDRYNAQMDASGQNDKIIYFTDIVGLMMSSVTDIVDIVSYALVAFVSVSLVVSSIMIGVITFVSVLERKKEIGILRAVGASKGNIRLVFNAETLIIGFVAGVIGIVVTSFIVIVANIILNNLINVNNLVVMAPAVPALLVGISMFLTFLAGLVPAQAAASKPPVEALRSE